MDTRAPNPAGAPPTPLSATDEAVRTLGVAYRSRGALLVFGEAGRVGAALALLPPGCKTLAISARGLPDVTDAPDRRVLPGTVLQVRGHLGRFRASVAGGEGLLDLAPLCPNADGLFDLVLDLSPTPLLDLEVPPLGYRATGGDDARLGSAIDGLAALHGTIHKPRFYSFDPDVCAFDRQGVRGCRRCLDRCPADAIGIDEQAGAVRVDPYLCQGCGSCAVGCPTGALRYVRPRPTSLLRAVAEQLAAVDPGRAPCLLIHATDAVLDALPRNAAGDPPERLATLPVPAIGAVGAEVWLGALALGAARVLILVGGWLPDTTRQVIADEVAVTRQQLAASGLAPERLRLIDTLVGLDCGTHTPSGPPLDLAVLTQARDKRAQINAALAHLASTASAHEHLPLPDGAAFGSLRVDANRCSACMACVGLCPTGALRRRDGALALLAADCVQCGICARACPEQAIEPLPCWDGQPAVEQILKPAAERRHCTTCGADFAPRGLLDRGLERVGHHPMLQGAGRALLDLCPRCRQQVSAGVLTLPSAIGAPAPTPLPGTSPAIAMRAPAGDDAARARPQPLPSSDGERS